MSAEWVSSIVASRLIGLDVALLVRRAKRGCYGPTQHSANGELLISTRGLELAARCFISNAQLEAAKAGKPLPADLVPPPITTRRRRSIEEIGRTVLMTYHAQEPKP